MLKIAVCDDEKIICTQIKQAVSDILEQLGEANEIDCFTDGETLENSASKFDLIFLDILGIAGVELAKRLRSSEISCSLIFVTVLEECMADAFEVEAIDYLCKPIDKVRLENALRRVIKKNNAEKRIVSQMSGDIKTVKLSDIYYCEVLNRKIYLNTKHGEVEFYGRLKDIEQGLDFRFMKCHRSYIINLDFLWEYKKDHIILINGVKIPVSRPKRKSVEEKIVRYIREETR